jgi:hypothetical protein
MTPFDHPSSQPSRRQRDTCCRLPALEQGRRIALLHSGVPGRFPRVPFVAAEVLGGVIPRITPVQDASRQGRGPQRDIRRLRAAHDEGQRDATPVHQHVARAPIFFPDPGDWGPQPLAPTALSSTRHHGLALSTRGPASRRIPSGQPATGSERPRRPATVNNTDESHSDSRTALWATLSTGCRFGGRPRSPQTPAGAVRVSALPLVDVDPPDLGLAAVSESTVPLAATRHRRLPMRPSVVCVLVSSQTSRNNGLF